MGRGTRGWGDGGTWRGNMAGWRAPQQPDKTAGSTYFGLRRSVAARPGSELGYAHDFNLGNAVKQLIWTGVKLHHELSKHPRNHVCLIKPIASELEGVVQLLNRTMGVSATGYLIESLWKFLISTELARSLYTQINSKPVYYGRTPDERDLLEFIEQNTSWIMPEFSIRLESAIHCCPVRSPIDSTGCRGRVSRCRSRRPEVPVKWAFSRRA